jgi:RNA polymerase sigma-70 factor (ECF subfamily)
MAASYEADPEVRLMLRVAADEPGSFEELAKSVVDPLTAFLTKQTGDPDLAGDLAQETLLRVFKSRATYRPDARFRTWLFHIAVNLILNRRRYESYRTTTSLDGASADDGPSLGAQVRDDRSPDPAGALEKAELADRVRRAVAALPSNQRIAVSLLRFHDLSYEEIGRAMNLTVQAVKSLLNRAKENLRRALAADLGSALEPCPARAAKGIA